MIEKIKKKKYLKIFENNYYAIKYVISSFILQICQKKNNKMLRF